MARTLDANLTTAVNAVTRVPALSCTAEDHIQHFTQYQTPGTPDAWHDCCVANDNSIIRVQVTRGGSGFNQNFYYQRITDPSVVAQWAPAAWVALPGSAGNMFQDGGCCVSNNGGTLRAFAQRGTGGNNIWVWTSTDNGVSWAGPVSVLSPPSSALAKGIASAGNNDVFFIFDITGGEAIGYSAWNGASWSAINIWTLPTISYGTGLAVVYAASIYTIVYSDSYVLASATYNPGSNTWATGITITPATSTAIVRQSPRIQYFDGLYHLVCIESDNGALTGSVYSYPRVRESADLVHWSTGWIMHVLSSAYGACYLSLPAPNSGMSGARYYLYTLATVYSAQMFNQVNIWQYLDLSASILSYKRIEQQGKPGQLQLVVDNNRGVLDNLVYVGSGTGWQPLSPNGLVKLSEGYKVGTPPVTPDVVLVGTYHINQIHFIRSPEQNAVVIVAYDLSRMLDLANRWQVTWSNQTVSWLITEVCARAGIFSVSLPATTQMSQVVPTFILQAGAPYRASLKELCETYGLVYFLDQNETMQIKELQPYDPIAWVYHPEIELVSFGSDDLRANHIIVSGKPPVGGSPGSLTTSEAYDDNNVQLVRDERLLHHVDQKLTTTTQCGLKASFLLLEEQRAQFTHQVTVPANPALQLYDGVTLVDSIAPGGSGQNVSGRVLEIELSYEAQRGMYDLVVKLQGL